MRACDGASMNAAELPSIVVGDRMHPSGQGRKDAQEGVSRLPLGPAPDRMRRHGPGAALHDGRQRPRFPKRPDRPRQLRQEALSRLWMRSPAKTRNGIGFKRQLSGCKLVLRQAPKPCPRRRSKTGQFYLLLTPGGDAGQVVADGAWDSMNIGSRDGLADAGKERLRRQAAKAPLTRALP